MIRRGVHDVIVMGAGLAGLTAALEFEAAGLDVLVLEGQSRVGGRIQSLRHGAGSAESGGTYIGAGYTRVIGAARRFGVPLIDVTPKLRFFREQDLALNGQLIRQSEWATHPVNPFPEVDKAHYPWTYHRVLAMRHTPLEEPRDWLDPTYASSGVAARTWLREIGLSDAAIAIGYDLNSTYGDDSLDISALQLFARASFSRAQRKLAPEGCIGYTAQHGVQRIPEAMAEHLRREPLFETVVTGVESHATGVHVHTGQEERYSARRVVCALPFGVLRQIAIEPALEGVQAEAVQQLRSQAITQVYLEPKRAFWADDGYAPSLFTDTGAGMIAALRAGVDGQEITLLTAWIMGPKARRLDALDPAEASREVIAAIERLRPAARGQLRPVGIKSWGSDPFAAGAWAYFRPGEISRFAHAMGRSHGHIHFCGEHLAIESRGMEGAMESGEAAAAEVLAAI